MNKKVNYETPAVKEMEFVNEGVLCSSDRSGGIDDLKTVYDWADDLWK